MSKLSPIPEQEWEKPSEKRVTAILKDGSKVTVVRPDWERAMTAAAKHDPVEVHHISVIDSGKIMVWKYTNRAFQFVKFIPKKGKMQKV